MIADITTARLEAKQIWVGVSAPPGSVKKGEYASTYTTTRKRGRKDPLVERSKKMIKPSLYLQRNTKMCNL
tara:strand:+ start:372 stop:584 length:213 start_codon:yes stop_codon:yes gene_type:complete